MAADRFLHPRCGHSEKVTMLTDLEFRVWVQYLLSADDYGVMRCSAVTVQSDNDHLDNRPRKMVQRCLDAIVTSGLLHTFDHQGRRYCYQRDWQDYQRIGYPRGTAQPLPPDDHIALCSSKTQRLFARHPSKTSEEVYEDLPKVSEIVRKDLPPFRARETLTLTLTANAEANAHAPADGEAFVDRYRARWKAMYGLESSVLMLSPNEAGQLLAQAKSRGWAALSTALDAYFATDDAYAIKAKHPLGLFLRDPNKYRAVAKSSEPANKPILHTTLEQDVANVSAILDRKVAR